MEDTEAGAHGDSAPNADILVNKHGPTGEPAVLNGNAVNETTDTDVLQNGTEQLQDGVMDEHEVENLNSQSRQHFKDEHVQEHDETVQEEVDKGTLEDQDMPQSGTIGDTVPSFQGQTNIESEMPSGGSETPVEIIGEAPLSNEGPAKSEGAVPPSEAEVAPSSSDAPVEGGQTPDSSVVPPGGNDAPIENDGTQASGQQDQNNSSETSGTNEAPAGAEDKKSTDEEPEYMDILGNKLLLKKVLTAGEGRETRPTHGNKVTLNIEGKTSDDTVVDRFSKFSFILGDGDVIQAWDLGIALMEVGEVAELITDSKYAYGARGRPSQTETEQRENADIYRGPVAPKQKIRYTLELLSKEPMPSIDQMKITTRVEYGEQKRERGNHLFKREEYAAAIFSYQKALKYADPSYNSYLDTAEDLQSLLDVRLKCYNNLAACQLKLEAFEAAVKSCEEVLGHQPDNSKALFRKGKALAGLGRTEEAITCMRLAIKISPSEKLLHTEMAKLTSQLGKENESQKKLYRKMLGTDKSPSKDKKKKKNPWFWTAALSATIAVLAAVGLGIYKSMQH